MQQFISKVFIVIEAESEAEACEAMSGMFGENLRYDSHIVKWSYAPDSKGFSTPYRLTTSVQDEDANLNRLFDIARSVALTPSAA